jgi:hypothetical protein
VALQFYIENRQLPQAVAERGIFIGKTAFETMLVKRNGTG